MRLPFRLTDSRILLVTYVVGIVGLVLPLTRPWFLLLTPVHLLLTLFLLLRAHGQRTAMQVALWVFTFLVGYGVEVVGVATGWIFGDYDYGEPFGPKVLNVPPLIGVNWLLLLYCFSDLLSRWRPRLPLLVHALLVAAGMTLMDALIEPVAIRLDFWHWAQAVPPLQNYVAWFIISFGLALPFVFWKGANTNRLSGWVLGLQAIFFTGLLILLGIFQ